MFDQSFNKIAVYLDKVIPALGYNSWPTLTIPENISFEYSDGNISENIATNSKAKNMKHDQV